MKKALRVFLTGIVIMTIISLFSVGILAEELNLTTDLEGVDEFGLPLIGVQDTIYGEQGIKGLQNNYAKDVERLDALHLLPDFEVNWEATATYQVLAGILEKLNTYKPGIVPANFAANASTHELTYAEAAQILVNLLEHGKVKYDAEGNIKHLNKLGINVNKVNIYDYLTGQELAHIVYKTLHQQQISHKKSILEDVYLGTFKLAKQKVLRILSSSIEMEYQGTFTFAPNMTCFIDDLKGNLTPVSKGYVAVGMQNAYLIVDENNLVQNIIMEGEFAPRNIRVLLSSALSSTGASTSYDFTSIKLAGSSDLAVLTKDTLGDHVIAEVPAGVQVTFTNVNGDVYVNGLFAGQRVFITSADPANQTTVYTTTRAGKYPKYDGSMEITPSLNTGKLYLVNDLYMEDYLHRVVPSEMPGTWAVEALKVQAVAARSYAFNHVLESGYENRSANVDDSTNCQVYNNSAETANVIAAVNGTTGIIMTYEGECLNALFSSTSGGYTANNEEVWSNASNNAFPGAPLPYTRALPQIPGYVYPDFNDEAATLAYYKDVPRAGFDFISPWYRWSVNMTRQELENTISVNLKARENADRILKADFVQTVSGPIPDPANASFHIGTLEELKVIKRGEGGNIMILEIRASNGVWRVLKEYNIRFVVRPTKAYTGFSRNVVLRYHTGGTYANYTIMPSAFASFEHHFAADGTLTDVTIYGGGNGHGVGMSQYGTKGQAEQGLDYETILRNYYSGIELVKLW